MTLTLERQILGSKFFCKFISSYPASQSLFVSIVIKNTDCKFNIHATQQITEVP